ncbi:MAG: DUF4367 domain-containing protein [Clostridiales bacterium]|nr:DUF4367 domain-containing protein [Clostridiales bacterium]MDU3240837.1 DUF4367 domain-containing protein [Clostridiales bacterium]
MEGKLRKNSDKIEPFPVVSDNLESVDDMDEALRQQLIKAADEYEKKLNSDPGLDYIDDMDESPELFAAVIQKLKDEKKWIDEEKADPARKEEVSETAMGDEEKKNNESEENREKVYEMLSDEDRRALAIGRRKMAQRRRDKVLKYAGFAAMICLCLFGVSMTSSANREYLMSIINTMVNDNLQVRLNDANEDHVMGDLSENEAWKKIETLLDVKMLKFNFKPDNMKYLSVNIDDLTYNAVMQYIYNNDTTVNIYIYKNRKNASSSQVFDGIVKDNFVIESEEGDLINVTELMNPNNEISYAAYFNKDECYYSVTAIMEKENFTKMLKNIYF